MEINTYFVLPEYIHQSIAIKNIFNDLVKGYRINGLELMGIVLSEKNEKKMNNTISLKYDQFKQFYENNPNTPFIMVDELNLMNKWYEKRLPRIPIYVYNFLGYQFIYSRYVEWLTCNDINTKIRKILIKYIPKKIYHHYYKKYMNVLSNSNIYTISIHQALNIGRIENIPISGIFYPPIDPSLFYFKSSTRDKIVIYLGNCSETNINDLIIVLTKIKKLINHLEIVSLGNSKLSYILSKKCEMTISHSPFLERDQLYKLFSESVFFINPIFNGDFELMPIEAILSGAPVISYILPFMEITGQSYLIANIENYNEVELKVKGWLQNDLIEERERLKLKILSVMDNKIIASQIYNTLK